MKNFSQVSAERLASVLTQATAELLTEHKYVGEQLLCARASDRLQRLHDDVIVVTEHPTFDGSLEDSKIDLVIRSRSHDREAWVEVKPMLRDSNYWSPSKFFNGAIPSRRPHLSESIILDDIDKLTDRSKRGYSVALALVLAVETWPIEPDETRPKPRSRLLPGQVLNLAVQRFTDSIHCIPKFALSHLAEPGIGCVVLYSPARA